MDKKILCEELDKAVDNFIEIADIPPHLRNQELYASRRAELRTLSVTLHDKLKKAEKEAS